MIRIKISIIVAIWVCLLGVGGCTGTKKPITIETATLRMDIFSNGYATVGVVKAETQVEVVSKHSGTVERIFKEVGEEVLAGDALLQLDTTPIMNQIKTAQASLDQTNVAVTQTKLQYQTAFDNASIAFDSALLIQQQAQKDYDNYKILFDAGGISKSAFDAAQTALDKADATLAASKVTLDTAKNNLEIYTGKKETSPETETNATEGSVNNTNYPVIGSAAAINLIQTQLDILRTHMDDYTVTSPIDGVIVNKNAVVGGTIGQSPVYSIAHIDRVIISATVPKDEINKLSLGGKALVYYADNSSVETQITALSNAANAANLYMVQLTVDNKDYFFKPGMNVKIVLVESQEKSMIVPFNAVVNAGKDNYIFMAENNKAKQVFVKVLGKNSNEISIEPIGVNLSEGVQIVTYNANLLKDGDAIKGR